MSEIEGRSVLVTGGCGFIGSEVTRQLSHAGARVTILDDLSSGKEEYIKSLKNVTLVKGSLIDDDIVDSVVHDKEYILNLAALPFIPDSYYYPKAFFDANVNGTITLASAAVKAGVVQKFVHISSSEIYGSARYSPMDENHPTVPQSTYAVSKLAAERVVYTIHKEHDLPAVIIRPFNSFGPNITQPYIIPEIINQLMGGSKEIRLGNINSRRDFTFVSDTARAMILALISEGTVGESINVGSERSISIKELVKVISKIMGIDVSMAIDPSRLRPHDVETLVCSYNKASRLLNWKPTVSIKEGLEITIDWVKNNPIKFKAPFKGWPAAYRQKRPHAPRLKEIRT
ncbi:MAG: NAD-dependent epimerase/dehydratase family protein, partial [Nitrososphaerales archaeon]